jgi:hypothetical protein
MSIAETFIASPSAIPDKPEASMAAASSLNNPLSGFTKSSPMVS